MKQTKIINLATGKEHTFINNLSAKENLISAYMIEYNIVSNLTNKAQRKEIGKNIESHSMGTLSMGDLAVLDR